MKLIEFKMESKVYNVKFQPRSKFKKSIKRPQTRENINIRRNSSRQPVSKLNSNRNVQVLYSSNNRNHETVTTFDIDSDVMEPLELVLNKYTNEYTGTPSQRTYVASRNLSMLRDNKIHYYNQIKLKEFEPVL